MPALDFLVVVFFYLDNAIGDAGAIAMAAALEKNSTLTTLYLQCEFGCSSVNWL